MSLLDRIDVGDFSLRSASVYVESDDRGRANLPAASLMFLGHSGLSGEFKHIQHIPFSIFKPILAYFSLIQTISSIFQPILAYSSLFKHMSADSSLLQAIPVYSRIF